MSEKRKATQIAIWIVLIAGVVLFGVARYGLSDRLSAAKKKLDQARSIFANQQKAQADARLLLERSDESYRLLEEQQNLIDSTFSAFTREEMAKELMRQLEVPSGTELLIARKTLSNYGRSVFIYLPGTTKQTIVVYAKMFDSEAGMSFKLFESPDHRIELPLPSHQLVELKCQLRETDSGCELFVQLGDQEPNTLPFPDFSPGGWSSYGLTHGVKRTNQFDIDATMIRSGNVDRRSTLLQKGIWSLASLYSYQLSSEDLKKQFQVAVAFESAGPFHVSPQQKYQFGDDYSLTWDENTGSYLVEVKVTE